MIFCENCKHLFLLRGLPPLCVANAQRVPGPLREAIDVVGVVEAEEKNLYNDCSDFVRVGFFTHSNPIRETLIEMMLSKGLGVQEMDLKEYRIGRERDNKERKLHRSSIARSSGKKEEGSGVEELGGLRGNSEGAEGDDILAGEITLSESDDVAPQGAPQPSEVELVTGDPTEDRGAEEEESGSDSSSDGKSSD